MRRLKRKAFVYITHADRLLVFRHPHHPEAGIQVPAGTIEPDENPAEAALREAFEETGLTNLRMGSFLGEYQRDMSDYGIDEIHHRYYFHLRHTGNPPPTWRHYETRRSDGGGLPIEFEFFWVQLPDEVPEFIAEHDKMLIQLLNGLATQQHQEGERPSSV